MEGRDDHLQARAGDPVVDGGAPVVSSAEAEIDAPIEHVWSILTAFERWPAWNPDVKSASLDGPVVEGATFCWKAGPSTISSTIVNLDGPRLIAWTGRTLGIRAVRCLAPGGHERADARAHRGILRGFRRRAHPAATASEAAGPNARRRRPSPEGRGRAVGWAPERRPNCGARPDENRHSRRRLEDRRSSFADPVASTQSFLLAVGLVGLHIVDDNFLQPEPGTSAGDHLASGLVPIAVLAACPVAYPRLRAGGRAYLSMTLGALAIAIGTPGTYHLVDGSASSDDYTGPLAIVAGVALLIAGPVILWQARRQGGSRRRRYLRRSLLTVWAAAIALATFWFIVFPVGFPYIYTHVGQTTTTPDPTVRSERVTVTTSDSLDLAARISLPRTAPR